MAFPKHFSLPYVEVRGEERLRAKGRGKVSFVFLTFYC